MRRTFLPIVPFALMLAAAASAADPPLPEGRDHSFTKEEEERALTVQRQFQDAGRELAETHAEAVRRPELKAPLESLRKAMETEMVRRAPEQKEAILRRYAIHREMREVEKIENPTPVDKEHYQALLLDFTNLTEALGELPKEAANAAPVLEERKRFAQALFAVMTGINPKTPDLMQQQKKSIADYHALTDDLLGNVTAVPTPAPDAPPAD